MGLLRDRVSAICIVVAVASCQMQQPATAGTANHWMAVAEGTTHRDQEQEVQKKKEKNGEEGNKGTLETFEEEATKPDSLRPAPAHVSMESDDSDDSGSFLDFIGYTVVVFVGGGVGSWYRVTGSPADQDLEAGWGRRDHGEPSIPFASLNLSYQNVDSDIDAYDGRAEAGFGPFAAHYRFTRFREKEPESEFDLSWLHGLLRLTYTRYIEVGLGYGGIFIDGTGSESGSSFTLPLRIEPSEHFGFEFRPTWGWVNDNTISDYDLALRLGVHYASVRGGYRWTKTGGSTLEGPTFGLLFSL